MFCSCSDSIVTFSALSRLCSQLIKKLFTSSTSRNACKRRRHNKYYSTGKGRQLLKLENQKDLGDNLLENFRATDSPLSIMTMNVSEEVYSYKWSCKNIRSPNLSILPLWNLKTWLIKVLQEPWNPLIIKTASACHLTRTAWFSLQHPKRLAVTFAKP